VKKLVTFVVACMVLAALAGVATAQDKPKPAAAGAPQAMPPLPKPGPEHAIFKDVAGTWDAKVESFMAPGAPPSVSTGVETIRVGCGGLCSITDFKASFVMGPPSTPATPFEGHGTETYDVARKKYVGSWVDSMSAGLMTSEGTYDAAKKTMTGWMEGPDMSGKVTKMKSTVTHPDPNTRVFSMYNTGADGKETLGMRITYTRKK
jgi:Protein of unknown function (DUF1579)